MRDRCVSVEAAISHSIFGNSESASHECLLLLAGLLLLGERRSRSAVRAEPRPLALDLNPEDSTPRDKSRASFALPKPPTARDFQRTRRCCRRKTMEFCREKSSSLPAHKMDHQATKGVSEIVAHERKTKLEIPRAWRYFVREPGVQKCRSGEGKPWHSSPGVPNSHSHNPDIVIMRMRMRNTHGRPSRPGDFGKAGVSLPFLAFFAPHSSPFPARRIACSATSSSRLGSCVRSALRNAAVSGIAIRRSASSCS